jgi:hypothetical protein
MPVALPFRQVVMAVPPNMEVGWELDVAPLGDELAFQIEYLDAVILPVANVY